MEPFGKTMGERMLEEGIREARFDWWAKRVKLALLIAGLLALGKYLLA